ncbi:hypothetical protein ACGFNU_36540 [Spirillospora sp. NPDC048911]|uniref:hypothetical protein n=1 Tax=Spirillospora sp. NPDC048911 TaxID=3364527 RepID=UPI003715CA20
MARDGEDGPPGRVPRLLPLSVGPSRSRDQDALREAVVQIIGHLVVEAVPPGRRHRLFDHGRDLLEEAGWGLDELVAAAEDGPARRELFQILGLS